MAEISDDVGGSICVCHDSSMGVDGFWWVCDLIGVVGVLICRGCGPCGWW